MKDLSFCFGVIVSWIRNKRKFVFCAEFMNDNIFLPVVMNKFISQIIFRSSFSFL